MKYLVLFLFLFQSQPSQDTEKISEIKKIFDNYIQYNESTDSESNKGTMKLNLLDLTSDLTVNELEIIINVWLYYDPTDFQSRKYCEIVFMRNKEMSVKAIEKRTNNLKNWESKDSAPVSELKYLKKKLID